MLVCTRFSMMVCTCRVPQGVGSNVCTFLHTPITFWSRGLRGNPKSPLEYRDNKNKTNFERQEAWFGYLHFTEKQWENQAFFGVKVSGVHLELSCCCCKNVKGNCGRKSINFNCVIHGGHVLYTHYVGGNQELLILKVISKKLYPNTEEFDFNCQSQDNFYGDP